MNKEQRKKASVDLTLTYLNSYYFNWRLAKVLTIEKILKQRHGFYKDIIHEVKDIRDNDGSATIAHEIKHGLYFDAIAHCVQYVEDLFAIIKASKQPDYFVRNIISYKAGEVTNFIKTLKVDAKKISEAYYFPLDIKFQSQESQRNFEQGVDTLINLTQQIISFYKGYEFIYNQYKHGLTVAMRPFGNVFNEEQIESDKAGSQEPYIAVYDNFNLETASKKGTLNSMHGVFMPGFTENVRPFIDALSRENNFLRFVFPPDLPHFSIDLLVENARKTRACMETFFSNYSWAIYSKNKRKEFQLPSDYIANTGYSFSYYTEEQNP